MPYRASSVTLPTRTAMSLMPEGATAKPSTSTTGPDTIWRGPGFSMRSKIGGPFSAACSTASSDTLSFEVSGTETAS